MILRRIFPGWGSQKFPHTSLFNSIRKLSTEENDVIIKDVGDKGVIILNRPKALNAVNLSMVNKLYPILQKWETEKTLVIVKGSGEKAFAEAVLKGGKIGYELFKKIYITNCLVGSYKIPYISIIDGIVMGGASELAALGKYSIATERSLFGLPETHIGLFPDAGGSYVLPRLDGRLGLYFGLTGAKLKGADIFKAGIATHYTDSSKLPSMEEALLQCSNENDVKNTLAKFQIEDKSEFSLAPYLEKINYCFSAPTVEEIYVRLEKDGSKWAEDTIKLLNKMSPTSLKISRKQLELGKNMSLRECFKMEYRMVVNCLENHDFKEGVKALLIDKKPNPKRQPATIQEVTDDIVNSYFEKLPEELELQY